MSSYVGGWEYFRLQYSRVSNDSRSSYGTTDVIWSDFVIIILNDKSRVSKFFMNLYAQTDSST